MTVSTDYVLLSRKECFQVSGKDLYRARSTNALSLQNVSDNMTALGWAYYPMKLHRYENASYVVLSSREMMDLLSSIDSDFKII